MKTLAEFLRDSLLSIIFHIAPRFANALLFILIGNLFGPSQAGIFNLAATYLLIFTTIMRGLDDMVMRQVTREPTIASQYLTNFLLLRVVLSLLSYFTLLVVVLGIFDYAQEANTTILILSLSILPDGVASTCQAVLLGQRRFVAPAVVLGLANVFKLVAGGVVLAAGARLPVVALIWLAGSLLSALGLLIIAIVRVGGIRAPQWFDWGLLRRHRRGALSFLAITLLTALESQTDTLVLSALYDERELGLYGAASTITFALVMLPQAYRLSIYPLMTRYAFDAPDKLHKLYERSMRYITGLVLPVVVGIIVLAPQIVFLVFDARFEPSAAVLRILIISLLFTFLSEPNIRMILVHDQQSKIPQFLLISTAVNVLLNLALAPGWGAQGAAVARLFSTGIFFILNCAYVRRHFVRLNLLPTLSGSVIATFIMGTAIWTTREWPLALSISLGIIIYVALWWLFRGIAPDDIALVRGFIIRRKRSG